MLQMTLASPITIVSANVPEPKADKNQVVIKIARSGICGSDIHAYYGKHPFIDLPVVLGHEFSGTIAEVGEGVSGFQVGDFVTAMPQLYCGECRNCKIGRYNVCNTLKVIGCQTPGASQEKLAVDAHLVLKLPSGMSFDQGAMLEPLAVGIRSCKRAGSLKGKRVLVLGAGTIGNVTAQAAKAMEAESVMITDVIGWRLEIAKNCGIHHAVNVKEADLATEMAKVWGEDGADIIIECIGVAEALEQAIQVCRKGIDIVVAGVFEELALVNMGLVQDKELSLIGTLMYVKEDWMDAISFVESKTVVFEPPISKHFPLADLSEAFKHIEQNQDSTLKVLIDV